MEKDLKVECMGYESEVEMDLQEYQDQDRTLDVGVCWKIYEQERRSENQVPADFAEN